MYFICVEWITKYIDYLESDGKKNRKRPTDVINNWILITGNKLKRDLMENEDYYKINWKCWFFIIKLYKGGPEIIERGKRSMEINDCKHYYETGA